MKKWHSKRNRLYHWTSFIAATHSSLHMIHHCLSCIIAYRLSLHTRHLLWIYTLFSLNMIYHCVLFISLHIMCRRTSRIMAHLMQRTAAHCNALQHTATHYNTLSLHITHHRTSSVAAHYLSFAYYSSLHIIYFHCKWFIFMAYGLSSLHMGCLYCIPYICASNLMCFKVSIWHHMSYRWHCMYVTWVIHVCDMTLPCVLSDIQLSMSGRTDVVLSCHIEDVTWHIHLIDRFEIYSTETTDIYRVAKTHRIP